MGKILPFLAFLAVLLVASALLQNKGLLTSSKQTVNITSATPTKQQTLTPTSKLTTTITNTPTVQPSASPTVAPQKPVPASNSDGGNIVTEKGNFSATVVTIDLNNSKMVTDTANETDCADNCSTLPLADFVNRNGGFTGINGSYFCPDSYPECASKKNSFDFPVYNSKFSRWINQGNLSWDNRAIVYFDGNGAHYLQNARDFNGSILAGITNYPGLVADGNVQIDDNQSGLSDKQKAKGTKVGIGVAGNKKVLLVIAQNVNMQEFAYVFKSLGATGALNLDTGGSTALYYNGAYMAGPGRNLPNAIVFTH